MRKKLKKPYKKPKIGEVKLVPKEAVLAVCKTSVGSVGSTGKCVATCSSGQGS
jgi:hypothetical protein